MRALLAPAVLFALLVVGLKLLATLLGSIDAGTLTEASAAALTIPMVIGCTFVARVV